jgi:hypothetical protein
MNVRTIVVHKRGNKNEATQQQFVQIVKLLSPRATVGR